MESRPKAEPTEKQDWILMCLQGGCGHPLAASGVATLRCSTCWQPSRRGILTWNPPPSTLSNLPHDSRSRAKLARTAAAILATASPAACVTQEQTECDVVHDGAASTPNGHPSTAPRAHRGTDMHTRHAHPRGAGERAGRGAPNGRGTMGFAPGLSTLNAQRFGMECRRGSWGRTAGATMRTTRIRGWCAWASSAHPTPASRSLPTRWCSPR